VIAFLTLEGSLNNVHVPFGDLISSMKASIVGISYCETNYISGRQGIGRWLSK
jgi:hypothetical protein